jgi:hypothetical protein
MGWMAVQAHHRKADPHNSFSFRTFVSSHPKDECGTSYSLLGVEYAQAITKKTCKKLTDPQVLKLCIFGHTKLHRASLPRER